MKKVILLVVLIGLSVTSIFAKNNANQVRNKSGFKSCLQSKFKKPKIKWCATVDHETTTTCGTGPGAYTIVTGAIVVISDCDNPSPSTTYSGWISNGNSCLNGPTGL
jgi:hypothetical protein